MAERGFSEPTQVIERPAEQVKAYARRRYLLFIGHLVVGGAFLAAMISAGSNVLAREADKIAGPNAFLVTVFFFFAGFSLAYLVATLPLTFYREYVLEHQFGLSTQTLGRWAQRRLRKWLFSFLIAAPLVLASYSALRAWPATWWLPASAVWILVSYVLTRFSPQVLIPLFYRLEEVQDRELAARLSALAGAAGVRLVSVCRIDLSRETRKANAAVVGLGRSRRVVLGDTLLAKFTRDEIAVIFAHELGHIARRDLVKGFAWASVLTVASLYAGSRVLAWAADRLGIDHVWDPQTLPVLVAVLGGIMLFVLPFEKWYSRVREMESDRYALRVTGLRGPFISAMKKLGMMNLADVRPSRLAEIFLFSHPPISKRIALAQGMEPESDR